MRPLITCLLFLLPLVKLFAEEEFRVCIDRPLQVPEAVFVESSKWEVGQEITIAYVGGFSDSDKQKIQQYADEWLEHANLKFKWIDNDKQADIRIGNALSGSWSYIGTGCKLIPYPLPTMNFGWAIDRKTVLHEFGHALGMVHEHQSPKADWQWNKPLVDNYFKGPPNFWSSADIQHNIYNRYERDQTNSTKFDPDSIMMYWFNPRWTTPRLPWSNGGSELSEMDKVWVAKNYPYPKDKTKLAENPPRSTSTTPRRVYRTNPTKPCRRCRGFRFRR